MREHSHTPKILVMVAVSVMAAAGFFYISSKDSTPTRASKNVLVEHQVVNVAPSQLGVFWEVDNEDTGWITYGTSPNSLPQITRDERDIAGDTTKRRYHFALMKSLEENTTYYYRIVSDSGLISQSNGDAFEATTLKNSHSSSTLSPIYGLAVEKNGEPARDALAMLVVNNAHPILTLTKHTGEWLLPLQYVVQEGTLNPIPLTNKSIISIQLFNDMQTSLIRTSVDRSRPLPEAINLGNNYSFIDEQSVLAVHDQASTSSQSTQEVSIRYPLPNAVIPGTAPLIKGFGIPGSSVQVSINTNRPISQRTTVDADGKWSANTGGSIPPGQYILIVVTVDQQNKPITLTRNFTIIKSGEQVQVLGESNVATPSASVQPTIITFTPSPLPTIATTGPVTPTVTPPPPVSGINMLPFVTAGLGIAIFAVGTLLLL
ncbi:MAG: fibronectin type III domain-containing protein [bacterium]|nr:fibronectin type III domain-containing protein [bacterium]